MNSDDQTDYLNYSYDAVGNLQKRQDSDLGSCIGQWCSAQTVAYNYGTWGQLTTTSGAKAESFAYNGDGSMTSRSGFFYTFDFSQQLVKVCTVSGCGSGNVFTYAYDGTGRRVQEVDAIGGTTYTTYYAYEGRILLYSVNGTAASSFVYLGVLLLFRMDSGSSTAHYYNEDLANNARLVWSFAVKGSKINVEAKFRYKPFGDLATPIVSPSADPRFKFASQDLSQATKLYHMGARYYAPDLGRFTSRDPVGGHGYAYAGDNPLSFWDPSGLLSQLGVPAPRTGDNPILGFTEAYAVWWAGASWAQKGAMTLSFLTNMGIGIAAGGLMIGGGILYLFGRNVEAQDLWNHAAAGAAWGRNGAYNYFAGVLGAAPSPAGARLAGQMAPVAQILGPIVLGIGIGAITDMPDVGEVPEPGVSPAPAADSAAAADGVPEDPAAAWYRSTFPDEQSSLDYHYAKHVLDELGDNPLRLGNTAAEYTRDAQKIFGFYGESDYAEAVTLRDGTAGIRIDLGGGLPGGLYTPEGQIVSFWYAGYYD